MTPQIVQKTGSLDFGEEFPIDEACVLCGEVITNPICIDCLEREMEDWLMDKKPGKISLIRDITKSLKAYTHDVTRCIICGRNMNVCAHCYVKELLELIKSSRLMKEFLTQFNYDLDYSMI